MTTHVSARADLAHGVSSTGLTPEAASALAYLAGPLSGALLLIVEQSSDSVRFHAWQAVLGLGILGAASVASLAMAFVMVIVSPRIFWAFIWLAALMAVAWLVLWALCVFLAWKGRRWKMPIAGQYAERWALGRSA